MLRPTLFVALLALWPGLPAQTFPFRLPFRFQDITQGRPTEKVEPPSRAQLAQWARELRHPNPLLCETALRHLIAAGDAGAEAVREACFAADPALSLRARQVFGAVHGVGPETHGQVTAAVARATAEPWSVREACAEIRGLGTEAALLAMRVLHRNDETDRSVEPLLAELTVRDALDALAAGRDFGDGARHAVLALSAVGAGPLWQAATDRGLGREQRLHALWLFGVLSSPDRSGQLTELLDDSDATLRGAAVALLCESLRPGDFAAVADKSGKLGTAELLAVAQAAARVVPREDLERTLQGASDGPAALAALALGNERSDAARNALAAVLENGDGDRRRTVAEAAATALGEFRSSEATEILVRAYASSDSPEVRRAAITSLRVRSEERLAKVGLSAALFDPDAAVRLLAADALSASEARSTAPALILAAAQDGGNTLQARVTATLARLLPDATASAHGTSREWQRWLDNQSSDLHKDELPWYRASREAAGLVEAVRDRIHREFFHFGKKELVDTDKLNQVAREAMQKVLGELETKGVEKLLLTRLLHHTGARTPEAVLGALGAIPFEAQQADLVRLANAGASAMVEHLGDPYSRLTASNDAQGRPRPEWLPGILEDDDNNGFMTRKDGDRILVNFVLHDSPAWWAGMQRGDQLIKIGDEFATALEPKDLRKKLRAEGDFTLLRDGWNRPYPVHLVPDQSQTRRMVTRSMLPGGIGYVRLKMFELGCSSKIEQAVAELERQGMKALVLDLRNNPGGTVADAISICDLFLPEGKQITVNVTRSGDDDTDEQEVKSTSKGKNRSYPIAVLVNECSASASEMTSGSLQGNGRAVIVGQTSFGKGIGQNGTAIPGFSSESSLGRSQSQYVLTLTMMRYYVPADKRSIHGTGVQPDLPVRERNLRGSALDKVMRAVEHKALADYVTALQEEHPELCLELCRFDAGDSAKYPGFDVLAEELSRHVDADELRRQLRQRLRTELLSDADDEDYAARCWDVQEDRTLRAALRELCTKADIDPASIPEFRDL